MRAAVSPSRASLGVLALAALTAVGCAAALRQPTAQDVRQASTRWPGTTLEDLHRGRSLYVRRCSGCHTLYLPSAYEAELWPALVDSMAVKARLDRAQQADITRFVVTLAPAPSH